MAAPYRSRFVLIVPGIFLDTTPRCGQCGDRETMDAPSAVASGLCVSCDPDCMSWCDGCQADVPNLGLTEVGDLDLCGSCTALARLRGMLS